MAARKIIIDSCNLPPGSVIRGGVLHLSVPLNNPKFKKSPDSHYTYEEAAVYLRISLRTLKRRIEAGKLAPVVPNERGAYFLKSELDRYRRTQVQRKPAAQSAHV